MPTLPTLKKRDRRQHHTDDQIIAALKAASGMVTVAARGLGCDYQTIIRRAAVSERVRAVLDEERAVTLDIGELALKKAVMAGEAWAVCFLLKTVGKSRGYVERTEVTGRDNGPIEHRHTTNPRAIEAAERAYLAALDEPAGLGD